MRARTWGILIIVNVLISAAVVMGILYVWNRTQPSSLPTPAPTAMLTPAAVGAGTSTPTAPPAEPTTIPTTAPLLYAVQEGDTLSGIAQAYGVSLQDLMAANAITDPNMLSVGQMLVIPLDVPPTAPAEPPTPAPTAAALPSPLPTLTLSTPPLVEIGQVLGSGDLTAETVIVRNRGGWASLEGWTLADTEGNTFVFPALTLFEGAEVRVRSAAGVSTPSELYWGRTISVWNGGELITLRDATGSVVNTYIVP
jgi:LysM repeat protein